MRAQDAKAIATRLELGPRFQRSPSLRRDPPLPPRRFVRVTPKGRGPSA